eukprot:CAMPEP_0118657720 /NCGR_PEP_ID=MMETSP0785-20121206/14174_1 /TAXON_ID=91992 /ORGANISM="Bolidomonas pacifica, Strain CCMP 1866" /LENGTH=187 /DNA_ID=CAMNT_0006550667 /DNA_START=66 /DNA_END=626 /DNA_ORIENTATION=-
MIRGEGEGDASFCDGGGGGSNQTSNPGLSLWPGKNFLHSKSRESPFGLLEELTFHDPWRLLLTCILLNRTTRRQVDKVIDEFFEAWPTYQALLENGTRSSISVCIQPCGMWMKRAEHILRYSLEYKSLDTTSDTSELGEAEVKGLTGCGDYAWDAYRIFVKGETEGFVSKDHALNMYMEWKRGVETV